MTFRIHFEYPDGTEDSIVLSGDTIEEIREHCDTELEIRSANYLWSEEL